MEMKEILTFGLIAALIVSLIFTGFAYSNSYSADDVKVILDEKVAEVQAQNNVALDAMQTEYEKGLQDLGNAAITALAEKDAELDAIKADLEVKNAEIVGLNEELITTTEELASEATVDETYPTGNVLDNIFLGDTVEFSLDDGDLNLLDTEITFDDDKYDVHEEFNTANGHITVLYSEFDDEEFSAEPYIGLLDKNALEYLYVFDDNINMSLVNDDEPLEITFLGQELSIIKVDSNEITVRSGTEFLLKEGDSVEFEGKMVTLGFVSENNRITVSIDGETETINEFDTETINGIDVRAEDILVNSRGGVATLVLGTDTLVDITSGSEWMDIDDSPFEFNIYVSGDMLESFSVSFSEKLDELDNEYPVLGLKDSIIFPNDYITLLFNDVLERDYIAFEFEFDDFSEELYNETDVEKDNCIVITTDSDDIEVLNEEVDTVYVCSDKTAYYQDSSNEWYEADVTNVSLVNDDASYALDIGSYPRLRIDNGMDLIRLTTDFTNGYLGLEEEEAEAGDVLLGSDEIGNTEYDVLTLYGAVIVDVENNADNDVFELRIPNDRVEIELVVY